MAPLGYLWVPEALSGVATRQAAVAGDAAVVHVPRFSCLQIDPLAARVEVPEERITDLLQPLLRRELVKTFLSLGFTSVSVDVEGLVSGKLNRV